jgi:predicted TIM-barrel fold metal-dependent hydrolase
MDQPSEYIKKGNWFYTTTGAESTLPFVLDWIGDDVVIFGSAYPDADSPFPHAVSGIRERKDISEQAKKKILGDNAKRLFGLA